MKQTSSSRVVHNKETYYITKIKGGTVIAETWSKKQIALPLDDLKNPTVYSKGKKKNKGKDIRCYKCAYFRNPVCLKKKQGVRKNDYCFQFRSELEYQAQLIRISLPERKAIFKLTLSGMGDKISFLLQATTIKEAKEEFDNKLPLLKKLIGMKPKVLSMKTKKMEF